MTKYLKYIFALTIVVGICYYFINSYKYGYCLRVASQDKNVIRLNDSFAIIPFISLSDNNSLTTAFTFQTTLDSVVVNNIDITIEDLTNSNKLINLSHIITYTDKIDWERINNSLVRSTTFIEFPEHYKTISVKREDNRFIFYSERLKLQTSKEIDFTIFGSVTLNGRLINFKKKIKGTVGREWKEIKWMT